MPRSSFDGQSDESEVSINSQTNASDVSGESDKSRKLTELTSTIGVLRAALRDSEERSAGLRQTVTRHGVLIDELKALLSPEAQQGRLEIEKLRLQIEQLKDRVGRLRGFNERVKAEEAPNAADIERRIAERVAAKVTALQARYRAALDVRDAEINAKNAEIKMLRDVLAEKNQENAALKRLQNSGSAMSESVVRPPNQSSFSFGSQGLPPRPGSRKAGSIGDDHSGHLVQSALPAIGSKR